MSNIKLNTRFGELDIDSSQIITFPRGLPGFETSTRWILFHELDEKGNRTGGVVTHLQSVDDEQVTLNVTEPVLFGFNYDLVLSDSESAELKLEDPNDILVLTTLSAKNNVPQTGDKLPLENMHANISAPILINAKTRIGVQKILVGRESKVGFLATPVR
ncbi:MAG: flagellar assembly protein FliW [Gallionella sp.]|jgi:flagellar assembly factor FliW